ncbi:hypothetical protein ACFFX0_25950 [Citricoccus parietis]|uniref:Uncharacterized protein n=1 Tax=Citricoccus parietis TaxID=592307 RepID=A0ABV5G683_9MICC
MRRAVGDLDGGLELVALADESVDRRHRVAGERQQGLLELPLMLDRNVHGLADHVKDPVDGSLGR